VVLLHDRRPLDPVTGVEQPPVVERRRPALGLPLDVEDHLALDRLRPRGVAVSTLELGPPELGDEPDAERADVDDLDLGVEAVPVLALVRGVERLSQTGRPAVVELAARDVEADLVALADVPAIGEAPHDSSVVRDAVALELGRGLCRELVEAGAETLAVERLEEVALGGDELVLQVGG